METSRNLEDRKDLRKVLVEEQRMTRWPKRSRCDFSNLDENTKGQASEIRVVEKPQRNRRNPRNVIWWNQA